MKHTKYLFFLLALTVPASTALAQTTVEPTSKSLPDEDRISAARGRYASTADGSQLDSDRKILAQFPRRGPGPPVPLHRGYPRRESYQSPWMDRGSPGHALIGAAIGFGIGAAVGAAGSAHNKTSVGSGAICGGALLGLIGGALGASLNGPHHFAHRRTVYPPSSPEDEEAARNADSQGRGSHDNENGSERSVSAQVTPLNKGTSVEAVDQKFATDASGPINW